MKENNRAYQAAIKSREYVHNGDKEGWLALFAEQGCIEDPIGVSMLDASGNGHATPEQREAFWDNTIAMSKTHITILQSFTVADNECANVLQLDVEITMNGNVFTQQVNGVFTYKVDDDGKILALRGYWEFEEALATLQEKS